MDWNVTKGQHLNNMIVFILWCFFLYAGMVCPLNALTHEDPLVNNARQSGKFKVGSTVSEKMDNGYEVTCSIEVENWTKYPLVGRKTHIVQGGLMSEMSQTIMPGWSEVGLAAHNSNHSKRGSYGTVSWLVQGTGRRLVIMWSVLHNHAFDNNRLGVGMSEDNAHEKSWFRQMYQGDSTYALTFKRKNSNRPSDPVIYRDEEFEVVGVLDNEYKAKAIIIFFPRRFNDLERGIKTTSEKTRYIESKVYELLNFALFSAKMMGFLCVLYMGWKAVAWCTNLLLCFTKSEGSTSPRQRSNRGGRNGRRQGGRDGDEEEEDDEEEDDEEEDEEEEDEEEENEEERKKEKDEGCLICYDNRTCVQLIPCGHKEICYECVKKIMNDKPLCPFCRQIIVGFHNGSNITFFTPSINNQ